MAKILLLHSYFHPANENNPEGGIEVHTNAMIKALKMLNHDVTLVCTKDSEHSCKKILINHECKDRSSDKRYSQLKGTEDLFKALETKDFDLVINSNPAVTIIKSMCFKFKSLNKKVPIIHIFHGIPMGIGCVGTGEFIDSEDMVIPVAVSKFCANAWSSYLKKPIKVLNSTFSEAIPTGQLTGFKNKSIVIACRLVQISNVYILIDLIKNHLTDYTFDIIGSPVNYPAEQVYYENCIKLAEGCDRIKFYGRLNQQESWNQIEKNSVFINWRPIESFGLAAFEAQEIGIPVVYAYKQADPNKDARVGLDDFCTLETSVAVNTYGLSYNAQIEKLKEAIEKATQIERETVINEFDKYGLQYFSVDLQKLISECLNDKI